MPLTRARTLTAVAHAVFVPVGIVTVLLGPMLPTLSARWSLNDAQAGALFSIQFAASTLGVVLSGGLAHRFGFRATIIAGLVPMSLGIPLLTSTSHFVGIAAIAAYGVGLGLTIPACNLLVAEVNPKRSGTALNLLNFSWSVGAVACPFLIGAALARNQLRILMCLVAGVMLMIAVLVAAARSGTELRVATGSQVRQSNLKINWSDPTLAAFCGLFFLYVGVENAVGGWIASYARHIAGSASTFAVMTSSFFYIALMVGRWLAPLFLQKVSEVKLARAGLFLACAGMLELVLSGSLTGIVIGVSITGFGLSAVYPITISLLSGRFGAGATRVGSLTFTMANFGGASLPWLVGYTSTQLGNLRFGLVVPLVGGVLLVILYFRSWTIVTSR